MAEQTEQQQNLPVHILRPELKQKIIDFLESQAWKKSEWKQVEELVTALNNTNVIDLNQIKQMIDTQRALNEKAQELNGEQQAEAKPEE